MTCRIWWRSRRPQRARSQREAEGRSMQSLLGAPLLAPFPSRRPILLPRRGPEPTMLTASAWRSPARLAQLRPTPGALRCSPCGTPDRTMKPPAPSPPAHQPNPPPARQRAPQPPSCSATEPCSHPTPRTIPIRQKVLEESPLPYVLNARPERACALRQLVHEYARLQLAARSATRTPRGAA